MGDLRADMTAVERDLRLKVKEIMGRDYINPNTDDLQRAMIYEALADYIGYGVNVSARALAGKFVCSDNCYDSIYGFLRAMSERSTQIRELYELNDSFVKEEH